MPTKARKIAGWVLHGLIGGFVIVAGGMKLVMMNSPQLAENFAKMGLQGKAPLIAGGELIAAVLFLIPRTSSLGLLLMSGFWGGVIATHMTHGESYLLGSVLLALTWLGAYLRDPRAFYSFQAETNAPLG